MRWSPAVSAPSTRLAAIAVSNVSVSTASSGIVVPPETVSISATTRGSGRRPPLSNSPDTPGYADDSLVIAAAMITSARSPGTMKTVSSTTWSSTFGTDIAATLMCPTGRARSAGSPPTCSAPSAARSWSSDGRRNVGSSGIVQTGSSRSRPASASASASSTVGSTRLTTIAVIASSPNESRPTAIRSTIAAALQRYPSTTATIGTPRCSAIRALTSNSTGDEAPVKSVPSTTTKSLAASIALKRATTRSIPALVAPPARVRSSAV